jgi:hypothetical protein
MSTDGSFERLYPIGALSQRDVADIRMDPFFADTVGIDALMDEWKAKSEIFRSLRREPLEVLDSDLLPLTVSPHVTAKIAGLLSAYRAYLPTTFELAFVPIAKLVSPQRYVELEYTRAFFDGLSRRLTDDENAECCLGVPVREAKIDATFLGYPKGQPGEFSYLYQFSSEDQNIRYIPAMPLKPLHDLDLSAERTSGRYDVKAITVLVGPGLPFVHVLKVPTGFDRASGRPVYRLITSNGIHRIFRLAELGNTHVAALVQTVGTHEVPDPFIETRRDALFGPDPLTVSDVANRAIGRGFRWKKSRRVIKLQVNVIQEISFVS